MMLRCGRLRDIFGYLTDADERENVSSVLGKQIIKLASNKCKTLYRTSTNRNHDDQFHGDLQK